MTTTATCPCCNPETGTGLTGQCTCGLPGADLNKLRATTPLTEQQLRDRLADALICWAEGNNDPRHAPFRRPETVTRNAYGRADAVLAVVQPELDRLAAELGRVRAELATTQAAIGKACTCWSDDQFMHLPDCHGNHITWNGQTWHAAASYADRDGGAWWLVSTGRSGEPEFRPDAGDEDYSAPLSEVIAEFGPLTLTPQVEIPQPF